MGTTVVSIAMDNKGTKVVLGVIETVAPVSWHQTYYQFSLQTMNLKTQTGEMLDRTHRTLTILEWAQLLVVAKPRQSF